MCRRLLVLPVVSICPPKCPVSLIIIGIGPGQTSVGTGIAWVDFLRLLKKIPCGRIACTVVLVQLVPTSHDVVVGRETIRVFRGHACGLSLTHFALVPPEYSGDGARDVIANCEDAGCLPVIPVGPKMALRTCI